MPTLRPASYPLRILTADDHPDNAESLCALLGILGHECRHARDGEDALKQIEGFRPHILFLDLKMPRLDGYSTARQVRANPAVQPVTIVAISGTSSEETWRKALDAGFDSFLLKPIDMAKLGEMLVAHELKARGGDGR